MHNPKFLPRLCLVMAASLPAAMTQAAEAQASATQTLDLTTTRSAPSAATSATVVPMLVRYSGVAARSDSNASATSASITFLIFKDEKGGEPLWIETQNVALDPAGRYETYLGSTYSAGLPANLFGTGEARWIETQIVGETPGARTLLTSVPYALKAADAATLGGLPASAFALAGSPASTAAVKSDGISADGTSNVTTTGGTNFYVPRFNGASTVINSQIYDNGTSVGIGNIPNPGAKLDVNGDMIMRGRMIVSRTGNATSSTGYPSYGFQFFSNVYNSSTKAGVNPYFSLQSEPTGNNTASPSATFNLLFSNNGAAPAETGFSINPDGTLHFAPGQTFPGMGTSAITGVTTSSPLTGGGTSGSVSLGLSLSSLETSLNAFYAQLGTTNNFAGAATFAGQIQGNSLGTQYAIQGNTTSGYGVYGYATGNYGTGVNGYSTGNGGTGVVGNATGGPNGKVYPTGVMGHTYQGFAVQGVNDIPVINYAAVLGLNGSGSGTYRLLQSDDALSAGVWADSSDNTNVPYAGGVIGTADNGFGALFENNSAATSTLIVSNRNASGNTGLFKTFMASTPDGACGIGSGGNLTCTGQMKSLVTTASNGRQVETYAMQSPENWMEDFGSGQLHGGAGSVTLDPVFAETVSESADYHVFLTSRGDSKGLYVTNATARGFEVRESGGGTASVGFDYRIVAKRRGMEVQRLTDVTERLKLETQTPIQMKRTAVKP